MGLYCKYALIYEKALKMLDEQSELLNMLKQTIEVIDNNKRKATVCIVGMKGSGKSLVLNYLTRATKTSDFVFEVGGAGTQSLQVHEGEQYDFVDTPPLEDFDEWIVDGFLDRIDICLLAHNVGYSMTPEEEEFLQKFMDRKNGLDYPIIKVLTFGDRNLSPETIEDLISEMNEKIAEIRAKSFNCSDKSDELSVCDNLFILSPGPSYIDNLEIIGQERYGDYYGYNNGSYDLADVRYFLLDNFSEQQAILTNAMFWALTTFYCSDVYQRIVNLHGVEALTELTYAIDAASESAQFDYDKTLEYFFDIVDEDFTNDFETTLEDLFREQKWRDSPSDDKSEVENEVKNLISVVKNQHIFTAKVNKSARDFIKSLMRIYDYDRIDEMIERYTKSTYVDIFNFFVQNGPEISYQDALEFVQECERTKESSIVSRSSLANQEWAQKVCIIGTHIINCQIIFGLDVEINEEFYNAFIDLCKVSVKIEDIAQSLDFDEVEKYDPSYMRSCIKEKIEDFGNMY